ncbi:MULTISPECIES: cytochrome P450 [unclassified Streptomyces]|uniref:cytochrome P450 n=1 Tax=unclassified Streptomyces TaxID=2593676 RepID=UPI002DD9DF5C|nr:MULTISPECIES: cytochrome P450 [unclassified Streptomyces]WSA96033.1 cytochrome P450 [Streptomyces sp. NBC_01795]WSB80448.1 cytochrome P450 [Streptomyces sp. NBC_01775]WSS11345.1 cytochrome P450 [Streptomyces sp. NBC_01186]WSS40055.1 cytochrome P450 [Streptomyces sp. NBC_01187]
MTDVRGTEPVSYPIAAPVPLEPPREWAELREKCPVARVTLPSGDEAALLTRYEDVKLALSDPRLSREGLASPDAARVAAGDSEGIFSSPMARTLNAEGHERWRRMVGKWFTAKRMTSLRPKMEEMADRLVDAMLDHGQPADLVPHLAFPLPVYVICTMLGVPESDQDKFKSWSDTFLNTTRYTRAETEAAHQEFGEYMAGLIAARRAEPGEDLLTLLMDGADAEGRPMSEAGLAATGQALLLAGHETTAGFIAMMTAHLLSDRRRWERLLADRALIRTAVEEVLRFDPNGGGFGMLRYVHEDTELSGGVVPSGTTVVCSMAAANRDESAWEAADDMDLSRSPNPHLAFGAGPHSCLGQPLARTELQAVLAVLLRRLPTLALAVDAEELRRHEGLLTTPLRELPVTW